VVRHGHPCVPPPNPPGQRGRWVWVTELDSHDYMARSPSPGRQQVIRPHPRTRSNSPTGNMLQVSTAAETASTSKPEMVMHRRTPTRGTSRLRPRTARRARSPRFAAWSHRLPDRRFCHTDVHAMKPNTASYMHHDLGRDLSKPEGPDNLTSRSFAANDAVPAGISSRTSHRETASKQSGWAELSVHDAPETDSEAVLWSSFDYTPNTQTVPAEAGLRLDHQRTSGQFPDRSRKESARQGHWPARNVEQNILDTFEPSHASGDAPLLSSAEQGSFHSRVSTTGFADEQVVPPSTEMCFAHQQDDVEHRAALTHGWTEGLHCYGSDGASAVQRDAMPGTTATARSKDRYQPATSSTRVPSRDVDSGMVFFE